MAKDNRGDQINAWFGQEMRVEGGVIHFEGCLRVDGQLIGGSLAGEKLIVGETARLSGKISVQSLTIYGHLEGRAEVAEDVHVLPGASFSGEMILKNPSLLVDEGGSFHGKVKMAREPAKK